MSGEAPSIARALNTLLVLSNPAVCSVRPRFVPKLLPGLCAAVTLPHEVTPTDLAALTPAALQGAAGEASAGPGAVGGGQRVPTAEEGVHACAIAAATVIFHFAQVRWAPAAALSGSADHTRLLRFQQCARSLRIYCRATCTTSWLALEVLHPDKCNA